MVRVVGLLRRVVTNARRWCKDTEGISGIGAVGLGGAGLAFTIAALAMTQADLLSQRADPMTQDVLDEVTVDLRVGEIMGRVDRSASEPVVSEVAISTSVGLATERFDMRMLTMRYTNGGLPLVLAHEEANQTTADGTFTTRVVRDMDGSMREGRVGEGDRIDLVVNLTEIGGVMGAGDAATLYFHTDGGTAVRLQMTAPRTLGMTDWVRIEGALVRGS